MLVRPFCAAALLFALAVPALAQTGAPNPLDTPATQPPPTAPRPPPSPQMRAARQAMMQACAADAKAYCVAAEPGGGKLMPCMRAHMRQLSPACIGAIQSVRAARAANPG